MTVSAPSPIANNSAYYYEHSLTPESLMIYLSTRLESVDGQIQDIFSAQQDSEKIRAAIDQIRTALNALKEDSNKNKELHGSEYAFAGIEQIIEQQIGSVDPDLAARMKSDLDGEGYILEGGDSDYLTSELEKTREYLEDLTGQLESTAQMNMIHLQSLLSARQTAISLSTNLIAKLNDSTQKVVENIR